MFGSAYTGKPNLGFGREAGCTCRSRFALQGHAQWSLTLIGSLSLLSLTRQSIALKGQWIRGVKPTHEFSDTDQHYYDLPSKRVKHRVS